MTHFPQYPNVSLLPVHTESKRPINSTWVPNQSQVIPITQQPQAQAYGAVCGVVSGNLEVIDWDVKNSVTKTQFDELQEIVNDMFPGLWETFVIESTPSGGRHIIYRCTDPVSGNRKLARELHSPKAFFETRGEGGYFVCAPSPGYAFTQNDMNTIPVITKEQRDILLSICESFSAVIDTPTFNEPTQRNHSILSPLDDYDNRGDVLSLLIRHGWKTVYKKTDGTIALCRPGKQSGVSATYNHPKMPRRLYVFTTSTNFDSNRSYKPSSVYGLLEHAGNFQAAARQLIADGYGERVVKKTFTTEVHNPKTGEITKLAIPVPETVDNKFILDCLRKHQLGDADLFAHIVSDTICFDVTTKEWYFFALINNSIHWDVDRRDLITRYVSETLAAAYKQLKKELKSQVGSYAIEAAKHPGEISDDVRAKLEKLKHTENIAEADLKNVTQRIKDVQQSGYVKSVTTFAKSVLAIDGNEWDRNPLLLGVKNGVISLSTRTLRNPIPSDYIRRVANIAYNPTATAPRWERFISEIFGGDQEIADFVQTLFGYGITGLTTEHIYPILHGKKGRNGKDTFINAIENVLGGRIATSISPDTIIEGKRASQGSASPHLYQLWGQRIVWVNETEEADRVKASQLKALSGGTHITCRPLYGEVVTFKPTHLALLLTNHKPQASADDEALWQRVALIPFDLEFVLPEGSEPQGNKRAVDKRLPLDLAEELEGIFNWLLYGCEQWQERGLIVPERIRLESKNYREEQDTVGTFISEEITEETGSELSIGEMFKSYKIWADQYGIYRVRSLNKFSESVRRIMGEPLIKHNKKYYAHKSVCNKSQFNGHFYN